jgi:hypothetical protein
MIPHDFHRYVRLILPHRLRVLGIFPIKGTVVRVGRKEGEKRGGGGGSGVAFGEGDHYN